MSISRSLILSVTVAAMAAPLPVAAQQTEGDANSPTVQWGRRMAEPGTFWLDSMDDSEIVRYTTPRDVRLCLPEATGVYAAQRNIPLQITWDGSNTAVLRPGNCLFFDARQVKVKPAAPLPSGATLRGSVDASRALVNN